ncbi:TonB-dependent vitamin B12 receptor [Salinisphaera dokdonensis CL-ES53]|uniref:TonB-dependent vitamin B12 receptor n=1 Tax=Salinisphaera dokdonensis CL-ES53 TaxID=1304272 RepID=A0ABV2AZX0_9GAMM
MNHRCLPVVALLGCAVLLPVNIAAAAAPAEDAADGLDDIVVTATRTPQRESATLAPTTVITREDIERLQPRTTYDLLRRSPGVSVANQGGQGKLTSIFMRGTESDHVLVLVDGIEYRRATSGQPAIEDLPVDQIERIEIVRGPRSSLYGSEAIGGVIQIFTRSGEGIRGTQPSFSIGGGSDDTFETRAGLAGNDGKTHYNISVSRFQTHGFDACDGESVTAGGGCFADEPDDDGYERVSGALNFGHRFDSGVDFGLNLLRVESENEYDGSIFVGNESDAIRQVLGTTLDWQATELWRTKLTAGANWDESENYFNGVFVSRFDTRRNSLSWQNDFDLGNIGLFTLGADHDEDNLDSSTDYDGTTRDNTGVFAQYLGDAGRHHVQLAGRYDDNEQFGSQTTGSATYGFDLTERYRLMTSYGTAFKAPTFDELYFPGFSNPDLDPETSDSIEVGLDATQDWGDWSLHAYQTDIDNLITNADTDGDGFVDTPVNVSESRIRGVEASLGTAIAEWQINAQATWLDAENRNDGANRGNELIRRPEHSVQLDVDREFARVSVGASLFVADSSYEDLANENELDAYQLVDLRTGYRFAKNWQVEAQLNNIFDETYQTSRFFEQPGRRLFVTLRYAAW